MSAGVCGKSYLTHADRNVTIYIMNQLEELVKEGLCRSFDFGSFGVSSGNIFPHLMLQLCVSGCWEVGRTMEAVVCVWNTMPC